eukprot:11213230-Lingulodinium_polyedra.AAC.1
MVAFDAQHDNIQISWARGGANIRAAAPSWTPEKVLMRRSPPRGASDGLGWGICLRPDPRVDARWPYADNDVDGRASGRRGPSSASRPSVCQPGDAA